MVILREIDTGPLSAEQQIIQAEQKRTVLRSMADKEIVWRQDAFDAEIADGRRNRRVI